MTHREHGRNGLDGLTRIKNKGILKQVQDDKALGQDDKASVQDDKASVQDNSSDEQVHGMRRNDKEGGKWI